MNNVYYFNAQGVCQSMVIMDNLDLAEELGQQSGFHSFLVSDRYIDIRCARRVNDELVEVPLTISNEQAWGYVRERRNGLLASSDWTQIPNGPLSVEKQQQWAEYRQALRNVTMQSDPQNIAWPQAPV